MTTSKQTVSLNNVKQLLDLNKDAVNFSLQFKVQSHDGKPFDAVVVDQETLDSNPEIPFQKASNGVIEGTVKLTQNVPKSYYLALRSAEPSMVDIYTQLNRLNDYIPPTERQEVRSKEMYKPESTSGFNWKLFIICTSCLVALVVGYYIFKKYQKRQVQEKATGFKMPKSILKTESRYDERPIQSSSERRDPSISLLRRRK